MSKYTDGWIDGLIDYCRRTGWSKQTYNKSKMADCPSYVRSQANSPFSAGQCPAHMVLEAINFLTHSFARYQLILKVLSRQTQQ